MQRHWRNSQYVTIWLNVTELLMKGLHPSLHPMLKNSSDTSALFFTADKMFLHYDGKMKRLARQVIPRSV